MAKCSRTTSKCTVPLESYFCVQCLWKGTNIFAFSAFEKVIFATMNNPGVPSSTPFHYLPSPPLPPLSHLCHTTVTPMSHLCHTFVTPMSHFCHTSATPLSHLCHTCHTYVTFLWHLCFPLSSRLVAWLCCGGAFVRISFKARASILSHCWQRVPSHKRVREPFFQLINIIFSVKFQNKLYKNVKSTKPFLCQVDQRYLPTVALFHRLSNVVSTRGDLVLEAMRPL